MHKEAISLISDEIFLSRTVHICNTFLGVFINRGLIMIPKVRKSFQTKSHELIKITHFKIVTWS